MLAALVALALAALAGTSTAASAPRRPRARLRAAAARADRAGRPSAASRSGAWRSIPVERSGVAGFESGDAVAFTVRSRPWVRIIAEFGPARPTGRCCRPACARSPRRSPRRWQARGSAASARRSTATSRSGSPRVPTSRYGGQRGRVRDGLHRRGYSDHDSHSTALRRSGSRLVPGASTLVPASSLPLSLGPAAGCGPPRPRPPHPPSRPCPRRVRRAAGAGGGPPGGSSRQRRRDAAPRWSRRDRPAAARRPDPHPVRLCEARASGRQPLAKPLRHLRRPSGARRPLSSPRSRPSPVAESAGPPAHIEPAPAPAPAATTVIPTPGGISPLLFAILALIAAIAGVVLGTAGAATHRPATDAARRFRAS